MLFAATCWNEPSPKNQETDDTATLSVTFAVKKLVNGAAPDTGVTLALMAGGVLVPLVPLPPP